MKLVLLLWLVVTGAVFAQESAEDIRGAKPLIEIPTAPEPSSWGGYMVGVVLGLLFIGLVVWWVRRRGDVVLSAEQKAVGELRSLEKRGADLAAGDFALAASGVVRVFIERKFGLAAPKRTTEEFLEELATGEGGALRSRTDSLRGFLKACDMAKFAGIDLGAEERGALVTKAKAFVESSDDGESNKKEDV